MSWYGTNDGCDCGCQYADPDCNDRSSGGGSSGGGGGGTGDGGDGGGGGNDDSRSFVEVVDPDTEVAAYVEGSSGDVLAAIAEKDAEGNPLRVTAAYYKDENGSSWTVFIGDEGLPTHMVSDGWTFAFDNYGNDTVDVTITATDGTTGFYSDIGFNTSHLAALESAVWARIIDRSSPGAQSWFTSKTTDGLARKVSLSKLFDIAGAAVSLGTCIGTAAATAAAAAGTFGMALIPGAAATSVSCFSAGVAIGNLFWGTEDSENLGTALSVAQCASGCASLVFDVAGRVADAAETSSEVMTVDSDGDGVFDYLDLCDDDFDPWQYDTDGDGIGDVCDPTPLDGSSDDCGDNPFWADDRVQANAGPNLTIDPDTCISLNGRITGGHPPFTVAWTAPGWSFPSNVTEVVACPEETSSFTFTVLDSCGVQDMDSMTVTVRDDPGGNGSGGSRETNFVPGTYHGHVVQESEIYSDGVLIDTVSHSTSQSITINAQGLLGFSVGDTMERWGLTSEVTSISVSDSGDVIRLFYDAYGTVEGVTMSGSGSEFYTWLASSESIMFSGSVSVHTTNQTPQLEQESSIHSTFVKW